MLAYLVTALILFPVFYAALWVQYGIRRLFIWVVQTVKINTNKNQPIFVGADDPFSDWDETK